MHELDPPTNRELAADALELDAQYPYDVHAACATECDDVIDATRDGNPRGVAVDHRRPGARQSLVVIEHDDGEDTRMDGSITHRCAETGDEFYEPGFPDECPVCGATGGDECDRCGGLVTWSDEAICVACEKIPCPGCDTGHINDHGEPSCTEGCGYFNGFNGDEDDANPVVTNGGEE